MLNRFTEDEFKEVKRHSILYGQESELLWAEIEHQINADVLTDSINALVDNAVQKQWDLYKVETA